MPKWVPTFAIIDCLLFICAWVWTSLQATASAYYHLAWWAYFATAAIGFILAVYGFIVLTQGGVKQMTRSTVCVLFSMIPGCAALIAVLSHVGHPV